ncbi:MAG: hypothetical protein MPK62_09965, partial [Alphaproteobacteria bacterium]|nr:hypothetical protein [Alphaproteobacteria bacterium]
QDGRRARVVCACGARFNVSLFKWRSLINNFTASSIPLKQKTTRLRPADGWRRPQGCLAVQRTAKTAEACRFLPSANFVSINQKTRRRQ